MQGTACAYDLAQHPKMQEVALVDWELKRAEQAAARIGKAFVCPKQVDVQDVQALSHFLAPYDVVVSAVPYFLNLGITRAAIAAKTHLVDMGGNTEIVLQQRALDGEAKQAGITVLPDAGLAPGLANLLAVHGIEQLDRVESVHIRVGGLPQHPVPPLNYHLFFSMHGLINEYVGQAATLQNGQITWVDALTEVETLTFAEPVGQCEAFHTVGGISTLPWTYEGRIETLDYKTIRYPGHGAQIKTMADLGLLAETPVSIRGNEISPREVFAQVAGQRLMEGDSRDVVLVRVEITGEKACAHLRVTYEIMDFYEETTGFTAMMRTTAFPVSILAQMLGDGLILEPGVFPLEQAVPTRPFLEALAHRNIRIRMDTIPLQETHAHA